MWIIPLTISKGTQNSWENGNQRWKTGADIYQKESRTVQWKWKLQPNGFVFT